MVVFSGGGTGGHLYPALAIADALRRLRPDVRAFFVGARRGLEARVLPERHEERLLLPVRGFARGAGVLAQLGALPALARSVVRALACLRRLPAEVVVVTGGYAGAPAGVAAALTGTPLVLQEQNSVPGLVTRALSPVARQIHLAFPEARERLPRRARERVRVTGNPVRAPEPVEPREARARFGLEPDVTVVLVVGGSQGSEALNRLVAGAVREVEAGRLDRPRGLRLLWATGPDHLDAVRTALGDEAPSWVRLRGYLDDMPGALAAADLAVSRAGAMATAEFLAVGLPSVLVPLPTAAGGHQAANARALDEAGAARHLPQEGLEPAALWGRVTALARDPEALEAMARAAAGRGRPRAADEIARAVEGLLPPGGRT